MIKKWFFDYWDNFFHFTIINIVFVLSLLIPLGIPAWTVSFSTALSIIILILGLLWLGILTSASALYINEIAQFRKPEAREFLGFIKQGLPYGLLYAGLWAFMFFLLYIVLPFYLSFEGLVSIASFALMFWTLVLLILAMQYYFPIMAQLEKRPLKILRKIFIVAFDNMLFTIFLFLFSILILVVSGLTAFLFFGPGGMILIAQVGFKLRLYKYDYLEENPEANRRRIPWARLIHEDSQRVGARSIRGLIFPWKD